MTGHHVGSYLASVTSFPSSSPQRYEIRIGGRLDARWATWFDGMTLTRENNGTTTLRGMVTDQAALHGLLAKVRDLGTPLISVEVIAAPD